MIPTPSIQLRPRLFAPFGWARFLVDTIVGAPMRAMTFGEGALLGAVIGALIVAAAATA